MLIFKMEYKVRNFRFPLKVETRRAASLFFLERRRHPLITAMDVKATLIFTRSI